MMLVSLTSSLGSELMPHSRASWGRCLGEVSSGSNRYSKFGNWKKFSRGLFS